MWLTWHTDKSLLTVYHTYSNYFVWISASVFYPSITKHFFGGWTRSVKVVCNNILYFDSTYLNKVTKGFIHGIQTTQNKTRLKKTRMVLNRAQTSAKVQQSCCETTFKFTRSNILCGSAPNCTHSWESCLFFNRKIKRNQEELWKTPCCKML